MGEPMNATSNHPKVKVSLTLADTLFIAGGLVAGKMEMECRSDKGLGINIMMVELFGIQELTSRDHSATSTFLHSRRMFQGPGLPPSNAVQAHPLPGDPPLPRHYHQARRGMSTFLFRIPLPESSPSSISFGGGLARVRYEVRASVAVAWKGERRLVTDKRELEVAEIYEEDFTRIEPEGVVIGENGKMWVQGRVVGGILVAGESACVELAVKNHSSRKNTGLVITLTRSLHLPDIPATQKAPLQISDTLTTVAFRGPEYIIPPGAEGVASLVFDVPRYSRGVKGGTRDGGDGDVPMTEALFEVRCVVGIKIVMGIGSKDILLDLPVVIVHPAAVPQLPPPELYPSHSPYTYGTPTPPLPAPQQPYLDHPHTPYNYPAIPMSPPIQPYIDQGQIWFPPPGPPQGPHPHQYYTPQPHDQQHYFPPPPPRVAPQHVSPPRPSSAGPSAQAPQPLSSGLPGPAIHQPPLPLDMDAQQPAEPQEGKGERASRIAQQLRLSSRNRSASPQSHRFPLSASSVPIPIPGTQTMRNLPPPVQDGHPAPNINGLSVSPSAVVHSPRPLLSPKHSYTVDPMTHATLPKSERVEELERMADEVDRRTKDLSGDIPKEQMNPPEDTSSKKTLPVPPVPSGKEKPMSSAPIGRPRVDDVFSASDLTPAAVDKAPRTPLNAVTPVKLSRPDMLGMGRSESGLDALERRLLAEVGTRKLDLDDKRPNIRAALPIDIPVPSKDPEGLNDSAISSLTLADREHEQEQDHDSDERTHKAPKSNRSGEGREGKEGRSRPGSSARGRDRDDRRNGKKKERHRDKDAQKHRKTAKGRVAAWLGGIDPDIPPEDEPPLPSTSVVARTGLPKKHATSSHILPTNTRPNLPIESDAQDISSAPNPRSSGFVPIGTFKRDTLQRHAATKPAAADTGAPLNDQIFTLEPMPPTKPVSPPSAPQPKPNTPKAAAKGKEPVFKPQPLLRDIPLPKKIHPSPRLPAFPPSVSDREVKYDIRSARGGRGGKVTQVASIWASGADPASSKPKGQKSLDVPIVRHVRSVAESPHWTDKHAKPPATGLKPHEGKHLRSIAESPLSSGIPTPPPETKFVGVKVRNARPIIKSASVPAVISSHATPTLSSTASLARPPPPVDRRKFPARLPPTIPESRSDSGNIQTGDNRSSPAVSKPPPPKDLAFGQARLRDLIKKYQG